MTWKGGKLHAKGSIPFPNFYKGLVVKCSGSGKNCVSGYEWDKTTAKLEQYGYYCNDCKYFGLGPNL
jgi:hypothetical protein